MATKHEAHKLYYTIYTIITVVLLVATSLILAYKTQSRNPILDSFRKFYPAVVVGSSSISLYDWQNYLEIAHNLNPSEDPKSAGDVLIRASEEKQLLQKLNANTTPTAADAEYSYVTSGKDAELDSIVNNYFLGSRDNFAKYLVLPEYYDAQLRIKYNSDTMLNQTAYNRAKDILDKIDQGQKFEDLAKTESDDKQTGQFGGDLGFINANQVLPELADAIKKSTPGVVSKEIVASRDGYHILEVVETSNSNGEQIWHVKHILIETTGYDAWLNSQLVQFKIWHIAN